MQNYYFERLKQHKLKLVDKYISVYIVFLKDEWCIAAVYLYLQLYKKKKNNEITKLTKNIYWFISKQK